MKENLLIWIENKEYLLNSLPQAVDKNACDDPKQFLLLSDEDKIGLVSWIINSLEPCKTFNHTASSYYLKHLFNDSPTGVYVTNGAFKGAMAICGFKVANDYLRNWNFNIKRSSVTNAYRVMNFMHVSGIDDVVYEPSKYDLPHV